MLERLLELKYTVPTSKDHVINIIATFKHHKISNALRNGGLKFLNH